MALGSRKASFPNLSLVSGGAQQLLKPRVISHDKLNNNQLRYLQEYQRRAQLGGQCVGALVGVEDWDIRPLVVEGGKLTITRFTRPDNTLLDVSINSLQTTLMKLSAYHGVQALIKHGASGNQIWLRRSFYQNTMYDLAGGITGMPAKQRLRRVRELLKTIESLHHNEIFHGHICTSNIAWEGEKPIILDIGMACSMSQKSIIEDIAPEIKQGALVNESTDVYGLGMVISSILPRAAFQDENAMIDRMLSEDILSRPTLDQAIDFFIDAEHGWHDKQLRAHSKQSFVKVNNLVDPTIEQRVAIKTAPPIDIYEEDLDEEMLASQVEANKAAAGRAFMISAFSVLMLLFVWTYHEQISNLFNSSGQRIEGSYEDLWQSGQPSLMQVVAKLAIDDRNRLAQATIIGSALKGQTPVRVKTDLIRFVFDAKWEEKLSEDDRSLALSLALAGIRDQAPNLNILQKAHPIVLLGIIGTLNVDVQVPALAQVSVERLNQLPNPFNQVFKEISKTKGLTLADTSVRAAAHLVLGDDAESMIVKYFEKSQSDLEMFRYLRALTPIFSMRTGLDTTTYSYLLSKSKIFAQTSRWFDEEPLGKWEEVSRAQKLSILAGGEVKAQLTFERLCDLMKFPNPKVSEVAALELKDRFYGGKLEGLLKFMSSRENRLTRAQTISIMAALPLTGHEADTFYARWFAGNPDAESVNTMLLLRSDVSKSDVFNIQAANYLTSKSFTISIANLKKMVIHPEPLARALAYSRLRKSVPEELELLQSMALAEPDNSLREKIKARLRD
jgi:hypothetical protein